MAVVAMTCQKLLMRKTPIEFLSGSEIPPEHGWHMPMHSHPIHELIVVLGGRMRLETETEDLMTQAGDLLFYHSGMSHRETSDEAHPVNTFFIAFKGEDSVLDQFPLRMRDADARVRQMVSWMVRDHQAGIAPSQQTDLLKAVINEMDRLWTTPIDPWLQDLREFMRSRLPQKLYLADLARQAGMSKFAFVRKFKRLSGRTPMQDLQSMRLDQARTMLLASGLPLKAIAPEVGLGDEYQLSKLFRRHFRLSPTQLRMRTTDTRLLASIP